MFGFVCSFLFGVPVVFNPNKIQHEIKIFIGRYRSVYLKIPPMKRKILPDIIYLLCIFFKIFSSFVQTTRNGTAIIKWSATTNWTSGMPRATTENPTVSLKANNKSQILKILIYLNHYYENNLHLKTRYLSWFSSLLYYYCLGIINQGQFPEL